MYSMKFNESYTWEEIEDEVRLEHLLHKVLTETTSAQLIVLSYSEPNSMMHPWGIDCNTTLVLSNTRELDRVSSTS